MAQETISFENEEAMIDLLDSPGLLTILIAAILLLSCLRKKGYLLIGMTRSSRAILRHNAGCRLLAKAKYAEASAKFSEAIRLNPQQAASLASRGVAAFHLNQFDNALADFEEGLRLSPQNATILANRAHLHLTQGNLDAALSDANAALEIDPRDESALGCRVGIWTKRESLDRAFEDCNQLIANGHQFGEYYYIRGSVYFTRNDYGNAVEDFNEAIRLGELRALSNRGMVWLGIRDYDRAIADFEAAIDYDPNDALHFNNRGAAYLKKGEYSKAIVDLQRAMRMNPTFANPYKNLAWLRATCPKGEFRDGAEAVYFARKALDLVGKSATAEWFDIMAAAYAEAGDFENAVTWQVRSVECANADSLSDLKGRLEKYQRREKFRDCLSVS